jgi:hypothetical protein
MQGDEKYKDWVFVPEITRQIKDKYGVDINEQGNVETQILILNEHINNWYNTVGSEKNVVMDRCILDGLVYTTYMHLSRKRNRTKEFRTLVSYAELLVNTYASNVDVIFYTEPDIPLVDDGVRSVNKSFRRRIIKMFEEAFDHFELENVVRLKGSVDERMETINNTITKLQNG